MAKPAAKKQGNLTLLIFKDDLVARTFSIPMRWFTQLGMSVGAIAAVILVLLFFSVKYYRISLKSDPSRILDLERELTDLRQSYATLQDQLAKRPKAAEQGPGLPESTDTVARTETPTTQIPSVPSGVTATPVASASPAASSPDGASEIPIQLGGFETSWVGTHLIVRFHISYINKDGGNQQGRIGVLLKNDRIAMAYPRAVLKNAETQALAPERGEFFSVSRYREVRAEFESVPAGQSFKEIQVLIFDKGGEVLIEKQLKVPAYVPTSQSGEEDPEPETTAPTEESTRGDRSNRG
ncbi:MAG: hypothetical protein AB7P04_07275 [Bacteriovoracia bacterium]